MTACDSTGIDQSNLSAESSVEEEKDPASTEAEPLMPDKELLGSDYVELESKRTDYRRVFQRADGKRVAIFRGVSVTDARSADTKAKNIDYASTSDRSFYRYINTKLILEPYPTDGTFKSSTADESDVSAKRKSAKSGTYNYASSTFNLVGNLPTFNNDYSDELFRFGIKFGGFSSLNVGTVNDIRFEFDPDEAFPSTDRRDGTINVLEYDDDPSSQFASESVFNALSQGDELISKAVEPEDGLYDFDETYTSGDKFFDYLEPAIKNGNDISVSVVADDESTSGAALAMKFIDVTITYDPPALAPSSPPSLLSPADGATVRTAASLVWGTVDAEPGPTYEVQLDEDPNFGSPRTKSTTSTSVTFGSLTVGETYYWRVKASNSEGSTSFSDSRQFTRGDDELVITISGPQGVTSGEQRTWSSSVSGGNGPGSYSVRQWSARQSYSNTFTNIGTGSSIDYTFSHTEQVRQDARIRVTVSDGEQTDTRTKYITVYASEDDACKSADKIVACP